MRWHCHLRWIGAQVKCVFSMFCFVFNDVDCTFIWAPCLNGSMKILQRWCLVTKNQITFVVSVEKIYFIDYVLIFESHYSPKKKHLNEFEWYALQRRIMARLIGRTFWSARTWDTAHILLISLCELKMISIHAVACISRCLCLSLIISHQIYFFWQD